MPKEQKAMSLGDWIVAQRKDPAIREIKYLISKNKLEGHKVYSQDPQIIKQYLRQCSHLLLYKGVQYRWVTLSKEDWNTLQLTPPQSWQKKTLQGCHNDISHMG